MYTIFILLHILSGSSCLIIGLIVALSKKQVGKHTSLGEVYHWSYLVLFISSVVTSIIHWEESAYLFYIAIFSYGLALFGYLSGKLRVNHWLPKHIVGMLGSYIGIVTAVLVVNVATLSIFEHWPVFIFWLLPSIIGTPIIFIVGNRVTSKYFK